jgi:pantoate--beta-alanine ligase
MIVAYSRAELAAGLKSLRAGSGRLGFVPTMGYLHEGHLSLLDVANQRSDAVAVSVFVNPFQFGPTEDLGSYPRDTDRDLALLEKRGADLVFLPEVSEMYASGDPRVMADPGPIGSRLCGAYRPGHFRGVLTVVAKLFGLIQPELAVFGRKDFQQLVLIKHMVRDLEFEVEIVGAPIVREKDGLAMSSRNAYLSAEERQEAPALHRGLAATVARFRTGERGAGALLETLREQFAGLPLLRLQYAEVVDRASLDDVDPVLPGSVLAIAAFCGGTRLIDNATME